MRLPIPPLPDGRKRIETGVIAAGLVVVVLDQITKSVISQTLGRPDVPHSVEVVGNWVRLSYTTNSGAAFGMFPAGTIVFTIIAIIAVPVLLLARSYVADRSWWITVIFGMMAGGALGNLLDRIRMGHVVDFIDVGIGNLRWPSFNVADSSFVVGVILLAIYLSFTGDTTEKARDDQHPDQPYALR